MFEAMRRIIDCLGQKIVGECGFARAIRHSFLGILSKAVFPNNHNTIRHSFLGILSKTVFPSKLC